MGTHPAVPPHPSLCHALCFFGCSPRTVEEDSIARRVRQPLITLSFDVSFMTARAGLKSAFLWVYMAEGSADIAGKRIVARDKDAAGPGGGMPCMDCPAVGYGTIKGAGRWVKISLDHAFAAKKLRCQGIISLVLALSGGGAETRATLHQASGRGTPVLLINANCGSAQRASC